jgi:glycosyltransferase involved in cell wall biosynthesis
MTPSISIIIPTFNSADQLPVLLNSLCESTYKDFEVVINDSKKTSDNTYSLIQQYLPRLNIRYFHDNERIGHARKKGAEIAAGTYLLHLDSDMKVSPGLLAECASLLEYDFDALVIPEESYGQSFWAKCKWLEKKMYEHEQHIESLRAVTKEASAYVGGHNENLVFSEDKDFDLRVRKASLRIGRTQNYIFHNEGMLSLTANLKKKFEYARTAHQFANTSPSEFSWEANALHWYWIYLKNIRYLLRNPLLYVSVIFMKTCEFFVSGIGYLFYAKNYGKYPLIISHTTERRGTATFFMQYLRVNRIPFYFLEHPYPNSNIHISKLTFFDGTHDHKILSYRKTRLFILDLILDFCISFRVSLRLRNTCGLIISFGAFNTFPFLFFKKSLNRRVYFWGADYAKHYFKSAFLNTIYSYLETRACVRSDLTISATSRQESERVKHHGLVRNHSLIVPNGSNITSFENEFFQYPGLSFIYWGALTKQHGVVEFINNLYVKHKITNAFYIFGVARNRRILKKLLNNITLTQLPYSVTQASKKCCIS